MLKLTAIVLISIASLSLVPLRMANAATSFSRIIKDGGIPKSIIQTADGGYIVTGTRVGASIDSFVIKFNSSGKAIWKKRFKNGLSSSLQVPGSVQLNQIIEVRNGYVLVGSITSEHPGVIAQDFLVMKLDGSGKIIWARNIGRDGSDEAHSIAPTKDGGYIVSGFSDFFRNERPAVLVVKLDSSGNVAWKKAFDNFNYEYSFDLKISILQTADGGYILGGQDSLSEGLILLKLNATGNIQWKKILKMSGSYLEYGRLIQLKEGGYALTAYARVQQSFRLIVIRLNAGGAVLWSKFYRGAYFDISTTGIAQTGDGGFLATSSSGLESQFLKLDSQGDIEWKKEFAINGTTHYVIRSFNLTNDGGYILAGRAFVSGLNSVGILKLDSNASVGQCRSFNTPNVEVSVAQLSIASKTTGATNPDLVTGNASITSTNGYPFAILSSCP